MVPRPVCDGRCPPPTTRRAPESLRPSLQEHRCFSVTRMINPRTQRRVWTAGLSVCWLFDFRLPRPDHRFLAIEHVQSQCPALSSLELRPAAPPLVLRSGRMLSLSGLFPPPSDAQLGLQVQAWHPGHTGPRGPPASPDSTHGSCCPPRAWRPPGVGTLRWVCPHGNRHPCQVADTSVQEPFLISPTPGSLWGEGSCHLSTLSAQRPPSWRGRPSGSESKHCSSLSRATARSQGHKECHHTHPVHRGLIHSCSQQLGCWSEDPTVLCL